jgi:UDP-perosamine 4-acetyltransferase
MEKIIIYGAGGHCKVVIDAIENQKKYEIIGIVDDNKNKLGKDCEGHSIIGDFSILKNNKFSGCKILIAITNSKIISKIYTKINTLGYSFGVVIHPKAIIAKNVTIGTGTMVMANAVINPNVRIGSCVVINTSAIVEHDCIIDDFVHIAPGVHLAGAVKIGKTSMVGIGSTIIESKQIGENSIIGAGAVVIKNIPDNVTAIGVPAKY